MPYSGIEPSIHALEYLQPALRLYLSIVPKFDLGEVPDRFIALAFYPGVLELCFTYAEYVPEKEEEERIGKAHV
jgi:hypothetical protein